MKIQNLEGLANLRKLKLNSNIITVIDESIGKLTMLEWLDLSFNNISKIENLDKLTNLQDLSLANNQITRIEKMEKLTKLNVLSLGYNHLHPTEPVRNAIEYIYNTFPNIQAISMRGNG